MSFEQALLQAKGISGRLKDSLPASVDVAALGTISKAPMLALCTREALIWRTEELSRSACDALERGDFAVAAILARSVAESAAFCWKLLGVIESRHTLSESELHDTLKRLLLGSREWTDAPQPFGILSCVDSLDKIVPGFRAAYDSLSEFAHPNWKGVLGLFSRADEANLITYFGRDIGKTSDRDLSIATALECALALFEVAYNRISDVMYEFVSELASIWPARSNDIGAGSP